jgi:hypothetical protein
MVKLLTLNSFYITRKLTNWDTDMIVGRIHSLCQQINYKGIVVITIPITHSRTVIKTTATFTAAFRAHFVPADKYEVDVFWPYASHAPQTDSDSEHDPEMPSRKCLVRTESGWFKDWRPVLRAALLNRKVGWLGMDDWIDFQMKPVREEIVPSPWGQQS